MVGPWEQAYESGSEYLLDRVLDAKNHIYNLSILLGKVCEITSFRFCNSFFARKKWFKTIWDSKVFLGYSVFGWLDDGEIVSHFRQFRN